MKKHVATFVLLGVFTLGAAQAQQQSPPEAAPSGVIHILKTKEEEIGDERKRFTATFSMQTVPEQPKLNMAFGIVKKGTCPITYRPTIVRVNETVVKELWIRDMELGPDRKLSLDIPRRLLKTGANTLRIDTGECQYSMDVLKLNEILIRG